MPEHFYNLTIIGLAYDIIGVIFLAIGVFWKSAKDIREEAGTYFNANPHLLKSLVKSQVDTITGLVFLVGGFSLQILGALKVALHEIFIWGLWIILSAVILMYISGARKIIIEKRLKKMYLGKTEKE